MWRALLLASLIASSEAGAAELPKLDARVVRVATWKNGLAAITREARMPASAGDYELDMPPAMHGSLWVGLPAGAHLDEIAAEDVPSERATASLEDLLCASIGQVVVIERNAEAPSLRGRLLRAPCPGDRRPLEQPEWVGIPQQWIEVETDDGVVAFHAGSVGALTMPGTSARAARGTRRRVRLRFDAVAGTTCEITSIVRGIAWAPTARLDLIGPTRARLTASATLVNEVEPFEHVALDLVSGPARFSMANVESPLTATSLLGYFQSLSGQGGAAYAVSRVVMQNAMPSLGATGVTYDLGGSDAETAVEDASLRRLEDVSLAKGAASWRPLFSEEVAIEHVMTWSIPSTVFDRGGETPIPGAQHVVRVRNATANPWTTQPIELLSGGSVVGQSKMTYTAAGSSADVVIAEALDLHADASEIEKGPRVGSGNYERTVVEGELRIENLTGGDVLLEVVKAIEGELTSSEPPAKDIAVAEGLQRGNPRHRLSWRLPLLAGDKLTLRYAYTTWVR